MEKICLRCKEKFYVCNAAHGKKRVYCSHKCADASPAAERKAYLKLLEERLNTMPEEYK